MRRDHYQSPAKWTKQFRRAIKMSHLHFAVYSYLESAPESHRTGIYFVTLATIAEMVRAERHLVCQAMEDLEESGLIHWDSDSDMIWVPCVCEEQFRWKRGTGSESDNKTTEARKHIAALPDSHLIELFLTNWPVFRSGGGDDG